MEILKARALAAGNIFGHRPVVRLTLFEMPSAAGHVPSSLIRTITEALGPQREETLDFPAWHILQDAQESPPAILVIEALGLLLQRMISWPVSFCCTASGTAVPAYTAVFEMKDAEVGIRAGRTAVRLLATATETDALNIGEMFVRRMNMFYKKCHGATPGFDALCIAKHAGERNVPWAALPNPEYVWLGYGRYRKVIRGSESTNTSAMGTKIAKRKDIAAPMLAAAGLPVPRQETARDRQGAIRAARAIGFPVVVKPAKGNKGIAVSVGLSDDAAVAEAVDRAQKVSIRVVVESVIRGDEYRLLVINGKLVAAALRRPAQVRGDGTSSIRQLVDRENQKPERYPGLPARMSILLPILIDQEALTLLAEQGLSPDDVPDADRVVFLRKVSNVSCGGDTVDVTGIVHPSVREVAERAANLVGLDVCGVDFLTPDITRPWWETGGAICEVNSQPGLSLHLVVSEGTARDVAEPIAAMLYPQGAPSRVPVVAFLSDGGTEEFVGRVRAAAAAAGRRVGFVSGLGDGGLSPDSSPPSPSHLDQLESIMWQRDLDAVLVAVSAKEVVRRGLGLDQIDLAVIPAKSDSRTVRRARRILTRVAGGHVIKTGEPYVVKRVMTTVEGPQRGFDEKSAGTIGLSPIPAAGTAIQVGEFTSPPSSGPRFPRLQEVGHEA